MVLNRGGLHGADLVILDGCDPNLVGEIETDVCIVGSGPAGITLARAWLGSSVRVCLIESGGLAPEPVTQSLYEGINVGAGSLDPASCRLRAFGGSTNVWGGGCIPLGQLDFEHRHWVTDSGWPVSFAQMQPYYARALSLLRIDAHEFAEGTFSTPPARQPLSFEDDTLRNCNFIRSPVFFGEAFLDELRLAPNIQVILHATVTSLDTCANASHVQQVKARSSAGNTLSVKAKTYVLACGGIENARLMLLSNTTAPKGVGNENDLVGRYFMDHPSGLLGTLSTDVPERITRAYDRSEVSGPASSFPELCLSESSLRSHSLLNARLKPFVVEGPVPPGLQGLRDIRNALRRSSRDESMALEGRMSAVESTRSRAAEARARRSIRNFGRAAIAVGLHLDDIAYAWKRKRAAKLPVQAERVDLVGYFEQAPNPSSRVRLGHELDALGQRKVVVDWQLTELDWRTYRMAASLFGSKLANASQGTFTPAEWLQATAGNGAEIHGTAHHMGTTRMAESSSRGVVNLDSRVHSVDNLYISGSSVFPTGGWAFPTFTIVALSLRLSDHLRMVL